MLVLLYYLSQNPNFSESVKPLMEKLKNSEEMLRFLGDLSKFTDTFGSFKGSGNSSGEKPPHKIKRAKKPQRPPPPESPTNLFKAYWTVISKNGIKHLYAKNCERKPSVHSFLLLNP